MWDLIVSVPDHCLSFLLYVNFMFYDIALGSGPVHMWRSRCQLGVLFTRTGPVHK